MLSYSDTLKEVFSLSHKRGMHCSLSTINQLCQIYNEPQKSYPTIHVAGTNGKGSVCTKIAATLTASGYKTGLYTSPHISTFRERIQINRALISEERISELFLDLHNTLHQYHIGATFFEIATLLSFLYFQQERVDVAMIETGLGGRWDATNVVSPILSIITSISYDHTEILGSSLGQIAREKGGIIKYATPVVIGPHVDAALISSLCQTQHAPLYQVEKTSDDYDVENQAIASLSLSLIAPHFPTDATAKKRGLIERPPCRFERHHLSKEVVLDVAHNEDGLKRLIELLIKFYPGYHYRFVMGFSQNKDISSCAEQIQRHAGAIHIVSGPHPRLASPDHVHRFFSQNATIEKTIEEGIKNALDAPSSHKEVVIITGSFFIMQEARKALGLTAPEDPYIWYDPIKIL